MTGPGHVDGHGRVQRPTVCIFKWTHANVWPKETTYEEKCHVRSMRQNERRLVQSELL